ncbi:T9SS type B sorting domain-containing protein [Pedobacter sp. PWIIR3]
MISLRSIWLVFLLPLVTRAQGPSITYPIPRNAYLINGTIASLTPVNIGTAVPLIPYGDVTTLAGSTLGYKDGIKNTAKFNEPTGVACDAAGNVYIADSFNHNIRKITPNGIVTTVAGTGVLGMLNGPAAIASFNKPFGLLVNDNGDIFVADSENHQIRKISNGVVNLYSGSSTGVKNISDGSGGFERFNFPEGLVFDPEGNLYVADAENFSVRKISPAQVVSTFAGVSGVLGKVNGTGNAARFDKPVAIARDIRNGNFYVADYLNNLVRMITPAGVVSTYAGTGERASENGPRLSASFDHPTGLTIDILGNVYVSDDKDMIRRISAVTGLVSTVAGSGEQGSQDGLRWDASFFHPIGLAFDGEFNLYVVDQHNNRIRKITLGGGFSIDKRLPAGLNFDPRTGTINGIPTIYSPETDYVVTAYNDFGESSTIITISVTDPAMTFPPIPEKTTCDIDFDPMATAFIPITYTSSNLEVATIVNGKIHIVGPGTSLITATNGINTLTQSLIVAPPSMITVNISTSQSAAVCSGIPITLTASVSANVQSNAIYQWFVNGMANGTNSNKFTSSSFKNGDEIFCTVSDGACYRSLTATSNKQTALILDDAICQAVIPGSFSPNGDGINDYWNIPMLSGYPNCMVNIYNRFGTNVFQSVGYLSPWNGQFEGKHLPVGVYYFAIDLKKGGRVISGAVNIIK